MTAASMAAPMVGSKVASTAVMKVCSTAATKAAKKADAMVVLSAFVLAASSAVWLAVLWEHLTAGWKVVSKVAMTVDPMAAK